MHAFVHWFLPVSGSEKPGESSATGIVAASAREYSLAGGSDAAGDAVPAGTVSQRP